MENEFEKQVFETLGKSQDDFEKQLSYISAGALGLSMLFIEKIVPLAKAHTKWLLIFGWCVLAATLFINLISHLTSSNYNYKVLANIKKGIDTTQTITKSNCIINTLNVVSIITLILGMLAIVIFSSINI